MKRILRNSIHPTAHKGKTNNLVRLGISFCIALVLALGWYLSLPLSGVSSAWAAPRQQAETEISLAIVDINGTTLHAVVDGVNIRSLAPGELLTVISRSVDARWLAVATVDQAHGWVQSDTVVFDGIAQVPVAELITDTPILSETVISPTQLFSHTVDGLEITTSLTTTAIALPLSSGNATASANLEEPTVRVVTNGARLNIRSGPNMSNTILGKAQPGDRFAALGRTTDGDWVQIAMNDGTARKGWVATRYVESSSPIIDLPVTAAEVENAVPSDGETEPATLAITEAQPVSELGPRSTSPSSGLSGKLVIQSTWGGLFYLYDLETGELRPITSGFDPALSTDGRQIAFTRVGGDNSDLFLIDIDGSNERKVFGGRTGLMSPKWSPDGAWLVFSYNDGSYQCRLVGISSCLSDTQIVDQLKLPPNAEVQENILNDFDQESRPNWMLARVAVNGDEYRDLVALNSARAPDWTAAGVLYQSAGGLQVTQDQPEAETVRIFADGYGYDWDPDWQPRTDGASGRIVFQSREGSHWEIFAVNPDGSGHTALTRPVTALVPALPSNVAPAWSPDGQHIAFLSNRGPDHSAAVWRVWVMNADGSNQRQLPIDLAIDYGFSGEQMIDWGK